MINIECNLKIWETDATTDQKTLISEQKNMIVDVGIARVNDWCRNNGAGASGIKKFGLGTSDTAVTAADTNLAASSLWHAITSMTNHTTYCDYNITLATGEGNGNTYKEAGLFFDVPYVMLARSILTVPIVKTALKKYDFVWTISFARG